MFIGPFALAFAGKRVAPRASLRILFAGAQLADLLWPVLVALGIEQVRNDPGNTAFTPLDFVNYSSQNGRRSPGGPIMAAKPVPDGFHTLTPYLIVPGVARLIDFLKQAFDAKEIERMAQPDGRIMHAEVKIGDSIVMMGEPVSEFGPMPASIYMYVSDTDAVYRRALDAGAVSLMEPGDQFYGDRNAGVKDPSGNQWWIATHVEDVPPDEMEKRAKAAMAQRT